MKTAQSRYIHWYSVSLLALILLFVSIGTYKLWSRGTLNFNNFSAHLEASQRLDDLKNSKDLRLIERQTLSDNSRQAIKRIESYQKRVTSIQKSLEAESYEQLNESFNKVKKNLNKVISYPEFSSFSYVLANKTKKFQAFVVANNWRTLTRIAKRVNAKLSGLKRNSKKEIKLNKVNLIRMGLEKDFDLMKSVTENSVLSPFDKNLIVKKLKTLETEMKMLGNYIKSLKAFTKSFKDLKLDQKIWLSEVTPLIAYQKIEFQNSSESIALILFSIISLLLLGLIGFYFVNKKSQAKDEQILEGRILEAVKEGVLPLEKDYELEFSKEFQSEFSRYKGYIHKRMSFGGIFQDAMPFSSILMDSNLNVVWANSLFYEHWDLSDYKTNEKSLTWDFLGQFTNLGENDPVLAAVQDKVAGIYQIQVKPSSKEEPLPYEMYVSPVEHAGMDRIMIFFYPLRSIEEMMTNQTRSILGPVTRTLDALSTNSFGTIFKENIKNDFDVAGMGELYTKFNDYNDSMENQKSGLMNEITRLEDEVCDRIKLVEDLKTKLNENDELQRETLSKFSKTKDSIVSMVEVRSDIENLFEGTVDTFNGLFEDEKKLISKSETINTMLEENIKAFANVRKSRDQYKAMRSSVDEHKSRIIQGLDQILVLSKSGNQADKVLNSLSDLKQVVRDFDKFMCSFSQIITSLDVGISKVGLIMDRHEVQDFSLLKKQFSQIKQVIQNEVSKMATLDRNANLKEDEMINTLKDLYTTFKSSKTKHQEIDSLLFTNQASDEVSHQGFI